VAAFFFDCAEFHDSVEAPGAQDRGNGVIRHCHWFPLVPPFPLVPRPVS
jgi:hypothetical protein